METNSTIDSLKGVVNGVKTSKKILLLFNLNTLLIVGSVLILIMALGILSGSTGQKSKKWNGEVTNVNLSATTLQWQSAVEKEAQKQGVPELVPYIMAIIEVESHGQGTDIMQSSESAGLGPNGYSDPLRSIEQGIKHLKGIVTLGKALGFTDYWGYIQSYNFGKAYISYLVTHNETHTLDVAENYSKNVVAPSLGNTSGRTHSYVNAVSQAHGKTYLYSNGGNYYYAELVKQYLIAGDSTVPVGDAAFQKVMQEALKYQGDEYHWGGDRPSIGFDCSGLVQWSYSKAGIKLPRVAVDQWGVTKEVSLKDAKPGDLVFFKGTYGGPDFISHVGIYIDETRMYDSENAGIGYHYWTSPYWRAHFDSIRRIVKKR